MADEVLDPEVNPDYHLEYDTNDMTPEQYAALRVKGIVPPVTPDYNINRMLKPFMRENGTAEDYAEDMARLVAKLSEMLNGDTILLENLIHKWSFWARNQQVAPTGMWTFWLLLAGRGFGKTRTGAEWVNDLAQSGRAKRIHLVAPTAADVRKVMVEGESGIIAKAPPWNRPHFEPSKLQLTWPSGCIAQMFSAEEPERLRGPQCDYFWADELCAWKNMQETWDMLMFGFRLGKHPQGCITTTPKPVPLIKELIAGKRDGTTYPVIGTTYDNLANLAESFVRSTVKRYEGTRLGRQELRAEILDDMPGSLWNRSDIDRLRKPCDVPFLPLREDAQAPNPQMLETDEATGDIKFTAISGGYDVLKRRAKKIMEAVGEDLSRITVNVDPNVSNDEGSDEIGITVTGKGLSGHGYTLADLSMRGSPNEWASTAVLAHDLFNADRIIGEANQGGNMVEWTIASAAKSLHRQKTPLRGSDYVAITMVHATRGKVTRAEPVSALYEQNRISHVGSLPTLEDQMCLFTSDFDRKSMGFSPDRVDSLVWGFTHLFNEENDTGVLEFYQAEAMAQAAAQKGNGVAAVGIKMKAPVGVLTAYGMEGDRYDVDPEGFIYVKQPDVKALRPAGFVEV